MYVDDITSYSSSDFEKMSNLIRSRKKERINLYLKEKDKRLSILGEYLLIKGLEELHISYCDCKIVENENGKPYLDSVPLYYSISHFQTKVVCVISKNLIGVDLISTLPSHKISIQSISTKKERKLFSRHPHLLIALKEAYIKMKGFDFSKCNEVEFSNQDSIITCSIASAHVDIIYLEKNYIIVVCESRG